MSTNHAVGCLPTPQQMLLLRAALNQGPEAVAAWEQWEGEAGLDRPDEGSFHLLPLVHRNLAAQGYCGASANTLKGVHRQAWSRNQVLFHQVRPLIEELRAARTPILLLKGAALAFQIYPDPGCRPMSDVDILVPASCARALWEQLERSGWRALHWRPRRLRASFFRFRHGMDFESSAGGHIDLHWHALYLCCHAMADEVFWRNAQPLEFVGVPVQTCDATAHLLGICVHGIVWSPVPPIRWVADALLLLRRFPSLDWERLIATSWSLDLVPYVHRALAFLRLSFGAPVPAEVMQRLEGAAVSAAAAAEFARESDPLAARTAWQDLLCFYARLRRSLGGASPIGRAPGFVRHLEYAFELDSAWALARQLARSTARRLASRPR